MAGEIPQRPATRKDFFLVRLEGARQIHRTVTCYNLDAIISVGYRVNSILGVKFRQWATNVLREYLLQGYSVNARLNQHEDKVDRRISKTEAKMTEHGKCWQCGKVASCQFQLSMKGGS